MKVLFCGDIVGRSGRDVVIREVPRLRRELGLDFVVVNGENAAAGFGITAKICAEMHEVGVDCITTGNHAWDQKDALVFIERQPRMIRPLNYPPGTAGRGAWLFEARNGARVLVMNLMGRIFMDPLDDPFAALEAFFAQHRLGAGGLHGAEGDCCHAIGAGEQALPAAVVVVAHASPLDRHVNAVFFPV